MSAWLRVAAQPVKMRWRLLRVVRHRVRGQVDIVASMFEVEELLHQPSRGRARLFVTPAYHVQREAERAALAHIELHQAARVQVPLHELHRHIAPADAAAQQRMLGAEVAQAPVAQRHHAEVLSLGQRAAVGEHQLGVLAQHGARDLALDLRQRMVGRGDRHHGYISAALALDGVRRARHPAADADLASVFHHQLGDRAQRLGAQPHRYGGEFLLECVQDAHQFAGRKHHIDHQRDFRFQPRRQRLGPRPHAIDLERHGAGVRQQRLAGLGEHRLALAAVEQLDIQLFFQIGYGVADHRLGAVQRPRRVGETAVVDDGDKHAELVEGGEAGVAHGASPYIYNIDRYHLNLACFLDTKPVL